jgi:Sec-independent protein translocase protein TatA
MFDFGFGHILLFFAIALVAIGPKQLPDVARTVGRFLNELKRASGDFGKTLMDTRESTNSFVKNTQDQVNQSFKMDLHNDAQVSTQASDTTSQSLQTPEHPRFELKHENNEDSHGGHHFVQSENQVTAVISLENLPENLAENLPEHQMEFNLLNKKPSDSKKTEET